MRAAASTCSTSSPPRPGSTCAGRCVPMESFDVEFGTAVQRFHIGAGSVRRARHGRRPRRGAPAVRLAAVGRAGGAGGARWRARASRRRRRTRGSNEMLTPVVTLTPEARAVWAPDGHVLREGEVMHQPALAASLDRMAEAGADDLYRGRLAEAVVAFSDEAGAALTAADLAELPRDPAPTGGGGRSAATASARTRRRRPAVCCSAYGLALNDRLPPARRSARGGATCGRWRRSCARWRGGAGRSSRGRWRTAARGACSAATRSLERGRGRACSDGPRRRARGRGRAGLAARHEPRVGGRRGRQRGGDDELDRLRLGRVRRRHRAAPEQHAGRGGPDRPRRAAAGRAADVDDVADHRRGARTAPCWWPDRAARRGSAPRCTAC